MLLLLLACTAPLDSADTGETADSELSPVDDDGDGYPRWDTTSDPTQADCDDSDPDVTPLTERLVPEGTFTRGATGEEPFFDTEPVREIWLSAYCVDVTEVTNLAFVAFLDEQRLAGLENQDAEGRPLFDFEDDDDQVPERILDQDPYAIEPGYEDHPVTEVFHWSGQAYCASRGKRLPSEAQWEKAARGTDARTWPWGEQEPTCERANVRLGKEGVGGGEPCVDDTTPVGTYEAASSPYGLVDMSGNVAEWVSDWYQAEAYEGASDTDPEGPDSGWFEEPQGGQAFEARLTRGGSLGSFLDSTKTWARYPEPADGSSNGVGFRCARAL